MDHKKTTIGVIGLGYVGLPMAVAFALKYPVIAFDVNQARVEELKNGHDSTREVSHEALTSVQMNITSNLEDLKKANFYIVAVPTPIDSAKEPDLTCMLKASETVGEVLKKGDIVVYESTVYPGATEEECIPVLEKFSKLKAGVDFFVGYSPERINPGDKEHTFTKIKKVVSAQTPESLDIVAEVYGSVVKAGVCRASSIKVAEAAKVIENTQRDLNVALMNELSLIFDRMGIDTLEVLEAAGTKWNFLPFRPGLVGGHCIGVDPYYLTYKARILGFHPEVILAGRRINDQMGKYIAEQTIKHLIKLGGRVNGSAIGILGFTFKENCPDTRNTRVIDIYRELKEYAKHVAVCDPVADSLEAKKEYGIDFYDWENMPVCEALILAVAHDVFKKIPKEKLLSKLTGIKLVIDVKSVLNAKELAKEGVMVWRL